MTVHLPTERDVVVDSKVPLDAYLAAIEATDDEERERHLDRHAKQLKIHLDKLAGQGLPRSGSRLQPNSWSASCRTRRSTVPPSIGIPASSSTARCRAS